MQNNNLIYFVSLFFIFYSIAISSKAETKKPADWELRMYKESRKYNGCRDTAILHSNCKRLKNALAPVQIKFLDKAKPYVDFCVKTKDLHISKFDPKRAELLNNLSSCVNEMSKSLSTVGNGSSGGWTTELKPQDRGQGSEN